MTIIYQGDCLDGLRNIPSASAHTCVTSPPYFGLRDYGAEGQMGLEATPEDFISSLVRVFQEVRRVLREDGTVWLNLGDTYNSGASGGLGGSTLEGGQKTQKERRKAKFFGDPLLKHKDLIGIPWRVAFALQSDGWYLRQDIIWHKPNPMPESVKDRCTKSHEYIFLLSKSPSYYFDAEAIKEPAIKGAAGSTFSSGKTAKHQLDRSSEKDRKEDGLRNKRSVWTMATRPYAEAHFATFPPDLIRPCILAGAPEGGIVLDPFMGSGTTALVARESGRFGVGCELNPEYVELIRKRLGPENVFVQESLQR